MRRWGFAAVAALGLSACQTDQAAAPDRPPPDAKAAVLANKGQLWKDPDSIKAASITAPRRHMGFMWHVCVRANAKNAFGGYTGEKDMLVGMYDDGKPPNVIMADATGYCDYPHEPFPELEGGYKAPAPARPKV
ncbi:hypothetical protein [Bradyrhizobium japonicum]|uniref:hypothetical protein n=1 Tax=Bradyrhizobium japonicum TaxID=375 RepID=UPI000462D385|nr:hypothetical protein [Bradyrhizobium japonicum]